ncbi:nickel insertion protein, partial [Staphylococcus epidermidis]
MGYGGGSKDFDFGNILRVIEFECEFEEQDRVEVIECEIDDMRREG